MPSSTTFPTRRKLIGRFLGDSPFRAATVGVLLIATPYLVPILKADQMGWYALLSAIPLLLLAIGLAVGAVVAGESRNERRFWLGWLLGLWMWLVVQVSYVLGPDSWVGSGFDLATDLLYMLFYLFIILALEKRAGLRRKERDERAPGMSEIGVVVLFFALVVYFILIPSALSPEAYQTWVPSALLYSVLDLYLSTKLIVLMSQADTLRWRTTYGLLLATALLWLVTDTAEAMMYLELIPEVDGGTVVDLAWFVPYLPLMAAFRAPTVVCDQVEIEPLLPEKSVMMGSVVWGGSLMVFAFILPAVHLLLYGLGWLEPSIREPRDWVTLVALIMFASLAYRYQRQLVGENLRLEAEQKLKVENDWRGQMTTVQRMAAGIAHDLGNALAVVDAANQVISVSDQLPERIKPLVQQVGAGAERARALTEQLKTIGGGPDDPAEPIEVKKFVMGMLDQVQGIMGPDIELLLNVGEGPGLVAVERRQLETVFANLAINAKQAINGKGKLSIGLFSETIAVGDKRLTPDQRPGAYARIAFEDDGAGISPDLIEHLFEPYFTTKPEGEGTGLGLAMVHSIARKAGGFVLATSETGKGSCFDIFLPLVEKLEVRS